jgi:hypothetical protein
LTTYIPLFFLFYAGRFLFFDILRFYFFWPSSFDCLIRLFKPIKLWPTAVKKTKDKEIVYIYKIHKLCDGHYELHTLLLLPTFVLQIFKILRSSTAENFHSRGKERVVLQRDMVLFLVANCSLTPNMCMVFMLRGKLGKLWLLEFAGKFREFVFF